MRKSLAALAGLAAAALALSACGAGGNSDEAAAGPTPVDGVTTIKIGASPSPHAKILEFLNEKLAPEAGLKLEIKTFDDYVLPNQALNSGDIDANYFQHVPYLEAQIKEQGYRFSHYAGVHIEPLGVYSEKVQDLTDLPDGAQIGITNDPSNQARALALLQQAGVITLAEGKDATNAEVATDVAKNPKNVKFVEADPATLVRTLQDVDAAVINGNFALEGGLDPAKDALVLEDGKDNPFANIVAVRTAEKDNAGLKKLDELLHSQEVKDFIEKTWPNGEVIPAF